MKVTDEEMDIAKKWDDINKYRSDIIADPYSFIEGMRYIKNGIDWDNLEKKFLSNKCGMVPFEIYHEVFEWLKQKGI